jgi:hypothetical protein
MNKQFRPEDLAVRPIFRVAGAILLAFLICVVVIQGAPLFGVESIAPETCKSNKKMFFFELGNLVLSNTPSNWQGPLAGAAHFFFAFILTCALWFLVKPLIKRI